MSEIRIEWQTDSHVCSLCGVTFAEGAMVYRDDDLWIEMPAIAHCSGSDHYDCQSVFTKILEGLGHEVSA